MSMDPSSTRDIERMEQVHIHDVYYIHTYMYTLEMIMYTY